MNILITSAEWKTALTYTRSFGKKDHRVSLISPSPHIPAFFSRFCKERAISIQEKYNTKYSKLSNYEFS